MHGHHSSHQHKDNNTSDNTVLQPFNFQTDTSSLEELTVLENIHLIPFCIKLDFAN